MEKIIIEPKSDEIALQARAVEIKNQFVGLGFTTRLSFIGVVQDCNPKYAGYKEALLLERWWCFRFKSTELHQELLLILDNIRHE